MKLKAIFSGVLSLLLGLAVQTANATTYMYWGPNENIYNPGSANWHTTGVWTIDGVHAAAGEPGSGDTAQVFASGLSVAGNKTVGTLYITTDNTGTSSSPLESLVDVASGATLTATTLEMQSTGSYSFPDFEVDGTFTVATIQVDLATDDNGTNAAIFDNTGTTHVSGNIQATSGTYANDGALSLLVESGVFRNGDGSSNVLAELDVTGGTYLTRATTTTRMYSSIDTVTQLNDWIADDFISTLSGGTITASAPVGENYTLLTVTP